MNYKKLCHRLIRHQLPTNVYWMTIEQLEKNYKDRDLNISNSYTRCMLIIIDSDYSYKLVVGGLYPKNDYTDYDVKVNDKVIAKSNVVAIDLDIINTSGFFYF